MELAHSISVAGDLEAKNYGCGRTILLVQRKINVCLFSNLEYENVFVFPAWGIKNSTFTTDFSGMTLTVFKRRCKFQISPNQIHLSRLQVQSSCRIIITTWDQFFQWHPDQMEANESRWEVKWWELKIHDHKVSEQGQTFLRHCWPTEDEGTEPDWCFSSSFMMEN